MTTLHFSDQQQKEMLFLVNTLMEKVEDALKQVSNLKNLNGLLVERLAEKTKTFKEEFGILTEMIVKNQIEYEEDLYEINVTRRIRGGFLHECPF